MMLTQLTMSKVSLTMHAVCPKCNCLYVIDERVLVMATQSAPL